MLSVQNSNTSNQTSEVMTKYAKLSIALQNYLHGAKYFRALKAFAFAKGIHTGFRKDGVTPEFQHQIEIALFIITLKNLDNEESCIIAAILHDVLEDYPQYGMSVLIDLVGEQDARSVKLLSKSIHGIDRYKENPQSYFYMIGGDSTASIVKGCDRIHNLRSMVGVFTIEKQQQYLVETISYFLHFLKVAAGNFPSQYLAYMNIRTMLKTQMELIQAVLAAECKLDEEFDDA